MEHEQHNPDILPEPDLYEREEKCLKAIRVVRKALLMRLFVTALLCWVVITFPMELWAKGLLGLVMGMNLVGALPLWQEWKKQKALFQSLVEQEEQ